MFSIGIKRGGFIPQIDLRGLSGRCDMLPVRIIDFAKAEYQAAKAERRSICEDIKVWSDQMTVAEDREDNTGWWRTITETATEPSPMGTYVLLRIVENDGPGHRAKSFRPVAAGIIIRDQHGSGAVYGVEGPWLGAGHVFRPYRGNGNHHHILRARLEALLSAGIRTANMAVAVDNKRSLCTALAAGFRPFVVAPDRDPDGQGDPLVYLHWQADWCDWARDYKPSFPVGDYRSCTAATSIYSSEQCHDS